MERQQFVRKVWLWNLVPFWGIVGICFLMLIYNGWIYLFGDRAEFDLGAIVFSSIMLAAAGPFYLCIRIIYMIVLSAVGGRNPTKTGFDSGP